MKKVITAFPRQRYTSDASGNPVLYPIATALMEVLGGSDDMRWEFIVYAASSSNARMQLTLVEGTRIEPRPSSSPMAGTGFGSGFPSLGSLAPGVIAPVNITGPYGGVMDAVLKVWLNGAPGGPEWVDMEVRVTVHSS